MTDEKGPTDLPKEAIEFVAPETGQENIGSSGVIPEVKGENEVGKRIPFENRLDEPVPGEKVKYYSMGGYLLREGMPCADGRGKLCWVDSVRYEREPKHHVPAELRKRPTMPVVTVRYQDGSSRTVRYREMSTVAYQWGERQEHILPLYWQAGQQKLQEPTPRDEFTFAWQAREYRLGDIVAVRNRAATIAQIIPAEKQESPPTVIVKAPASRTKRMEQLYQIDLKDLRPITYDDEGKAWVEEGN